MSALGPPRVRYQSGGGVGVALGAGVAEGVALGVLVGAGVPVPVRVRGVLVRTCDGATHA
jgi:hypothetical protein